MKISLYRWARVGEALRGNIPRTAPRAAWSGGEHRRQGADPPVHATRAGTLDRSLMQLREKRAKFRRQHTSREFRRCPTHAPASSARPTTHRSTETAIHTLIPAAEEARAARELNRGAPWIEVDPMTREPDEIREDGPRGSRPKGASPKTIPGLGTSSSQYRRRTAHLRRCPVFGRAGDREGSSKNRTRHYGLGNKNRRHHPTRRNQGSERLHSEQPLGSIPAPARIPFEQLRPRTAAERRRVVEPKRFYPRG